MEDDEPRDNACRSRELISAVVTRRFYQGESRQLSCWENAVQEWGLRRSMTPTDPVGQGLDFIQANTNTTQEPTDLERQYSGRISLLSMASWRNRLAVKQPRLMRRHPHTQQLRSWFQIQQVIHNLNSRTTALFNIWCIPASVIKDAIRYANQ